MLDLSLINYFSVGFAVLVGVLANFLVFHNAKKIGGGALAKVYNFFGIGMLFNLAGFVIAAFPQQLPEIISLRIPDFLFILGYTAMAVGAKKILDAAGIK